MWKRTGALALMVGTALCLASASTPAADDAAQVVIKDFMFSPMQLTTHVGVQVTWINRDDEPHTVVSESGLFRSSALDTGNSFSFRFDKPGTYRVFCSMHPQMLAQITVE